MKALKIIGAAICFEIIAQIVRTVGAILEMSYYTDPNYFSVWSKVMMPAAGPPPPSFYVYSIVFGLIGALIYGWLYDVLKGSVPGKGIWDKGLWYGAILFLIGGLPGALATYLIINLPLMLIVYWAIENLIIDLIGGIVIEAIVK